MKLENDVDKAVGFAEVGSVRLRYSVSGAGPDLLLIHGVGSEHEDWDGVIAALRPSYRTIAFDLRGHGESSKPKGRYELDDFVEDARGLLDKLGVGRCHLAGFSLGGLVAQGFALSYPERLHSLVLLSTVAGRTEEERRRVRDRLAIVADGIPGQHFENSVARWFTDEFRARNPGLMAQLNERSKQNDPKAYAAAYRVLAESDLADRLPDIRLPTLVATGEDDLGSNTRMARLMAERIPGARLHIFPRMRHSILTECPADVARVMMDFLEGVERNQMTNGQ